MWKVSEYHRYIEQYLCSQTSKHKNKVLSEEQKRQAEYQEFWNDPCFGSKYNEDII